MTFSLSKNIIYKDILLLSFLLLFLTSAAGQQLAILKYKGGGDWYANPTALPNLISFCNEHINTKIEPRPENISPDSRELYQFPIVFVTGHGNILFDNAEVVNLRNYLISGGFLHISDNYGMDKYIRREMKKVFPETDFQEIPFDHPIYHQNYDFDALPKIHEHDNKPAQGFGLFYQGRMVCFYDYETDLSDGWEDEEIHHDRKEIRLQALQMGANIISYAFKN